MVMGGTLWFDFKLIMKETNMVKSETHTSQMSAQKARDLKLRLAVIEGQTSLLLEQVEKLKVLANQLNRELKSKLKPKQY
jgi:hypothetical protein